MKEMLTRIPAHGRRFTWLWILFAAGLSACSIATAPEKMMYDDVAPAVYDDYDCEQLAVEIIYLGYRVRDLYELLAERHDRDVWQASFSWFYGITALFLDGDGAEAEQYRQLNGQFEAARIQALKKQCGFEASTPENVIANAVAYLESMEPLP